MYYMYLDKTMLPVPPSKISTKINNKNKTLNLINEGEINILKKAGLTEIQFDVLIPNVKHSFAVYKNGFVNAKTFLDFFEKLKVEQKPFQFIVVRTFPDGKTIFNTNIKVSLEEYEIIDDISEGFDIKVSIKLKQFRDYGTKICKINIQTTKKAVATEPKRETTKSPEPKQQNKTYTVVRGDCLWNIAKKFYGDGRKYTVIYNANKDQIKRPNLIYPGQTFTIPVL